MTNYSYLINYLNERKVKLVAVSKTQPASAILEIYNAGQHIFGENRVQEIIEKHPLLPDDIEWHLIGHLQTNKVKSVIRIVKLIQSVDSFKLLREINKEAKKINRVVDVLLQIHIAHEETKFGFNYGEAKEILMDGDLRNMKHIFIRGFMGIATFTDDADQVRKEFRELNNFYRLSAQYKGSNFNPDILSMGMSGDYEIAVDEGSTMVRIGSLIFGKRENKAGGTN
ncbi:MAG: YggS family pyridoxal phosphate-dependent enzyme [Chitinophagales bacterium]|nr:YggS family pyridoxal phosphate-dependent enzyme [Chitinophagales bacterium]